MWLIFYRLKNSERGCLPPHKNWLIVVSNPNHNAKANKPFLEEPNVHIVYRFCLLKMFFPATEKLKWLSCCSKWQMNKWANSLKQLQVFGTASAYFQCNSIQCFSLSLLVSIENQLCRIKCVWRERWVWNIAPMLLSLNEQCSCQCQASDTTKPFL